ncbi:putative Pseudouridylate synthase [Monocercomonoides exilis]|uniref:putative Pseudouridylate synthase n=1 Tax=Monocercomonoides exilis TaxID=2049356 RepID=UPI00355994BD|nr:putative Pseudouridylate synthase [Monocercomonoides exilis]|eukprot:MONOS_16204.1-p1 / transcript=MONOS_16204.1 / gene=MONOS_16204 / organism=Monocercomonoides_exilis_PA203 / gene_product=Os02g0668400 / transcript_product=Os02g0668400 / location=Mono_scaffold01562:2351-4824(-) / protein_length=548 / sequence_SO=supercontig / SO=protein_coding / is_pseudo=false
MEDENKSLKENEQKASEGKILKRRVALCFGYVGTEYSGLQINPCAVTVEGVLEKAISEAGGISPQNAGKFANVGWGRCARTDKGVHAAAQIVTFKLLLDRPDTLIQRINENLPKDIRCFEFRKVTDHFNAKNWCSGRTYRYLIPTFAFDTERFSDYLEMFPHLVGETVEDDYDEDNSKEWEESEDESVDKESNSRGNKRDSSRFALKKEKKSIEEKEKFDEAKGEIGKSESEKMKRATSCDQSQNTSGSQESSSANDLACGTLPSSSSSSSSSSSPINQKPTSSKNDNKPFLTREQAEAYLSERKKKQENAAAASTTTSSSSLTAGLSHSPKPFAFTPELKQKIQSVCDKFVGTRNYHNYTITKGRQSWRSCERVIRKMSCSDPFVVDGVEMVEIAIDGQSFILHQIRKMIGSMIAVVRGIASDDYFDLSFSNREMPIPLAPSCGLFLDRCHFEIYNKRFCSEGERPNLIFNNPEIEDFINQSIRPQIATTIQQWFIPFVESMERKFPEMIKVAMSRPAPSSEDCVNPRVKVEQRTQKMISKLSKNYK